MRPIIKWPSGLFPYDFVAFVPGDQGVLAWGNPANLKLSVRVRDRKIRMIKSSPIGIHVVMDITLKPHHSLLVPEGCPQKLVFNFLIEIRHGDVQERGILSVEKVWVVKKRIVVDHRHRLASDKWENMLRELAIRHIEPVFVRRRFPLRDLFKIDQHI